MDTSPERRSAPRVPAGPYQARLGRYHGGRAAEISARIVDISRDGALLEAPGWPEGPRSGWVRMIGPASTDRVPVRVVRRDESGRLGIAFDGPCPAELLLSATLGIGFDHLLGGDASDGRSRDDWTFGA
jgi:hypothetical protein